MGKRVAVYKSFSRHERWASDHEAKHKVYEVVERSTPWDGWVVGFRTIFDGRTDYSGGDVEWLPERAHRCVLVTSAPRQRAEYVPPDGFELL